MCVSVCVCVLVEGAVQVFSLPSLPSSSGDKEYNRIVMDIVNAAGLCVCLCVCVCLHVCVCVCVHVCMSNSVHDLPEVCEVDL